MKYNNINELDQAIERAVKRTVKFYYTDWKNYDRPTYMGYKGATERTKKHILLALRESGSYIFSDWDFEDRKTPGEIINYYLEQHPDDRRTNKYYFIDLEKLTLTKAEPEAVKAYIKGFQDIAKAA